MEQLIMHWKNDGTKKSFPLFPHGVELKTLSEFKNGIEIWLDIVRFMGQEEESPRDLNYYKQIMTDIPNYREDQCFFLIVNGVPAATITIICDDNKKEGLVHMVACKPAFRGNGLGHLLNEIAVYILKKEHMQTAHLTTDDWRIPAIKTYLKFGFLPDLERPSDSVQRWNDIYKIINSDKK